MNNIYFNQLERINSELENIPLTDEIISNVLTFYNHLRKLEHYVRKEGLLQLVEYFERTEEFYGKEYMRYFAELVLDGTDPGLIEELGLIKLLSLHLHGFEALIYMMNLNGLIFIQIGENLLIVSMWLKAMLPKEISEILEKEEAKKNMEDSSIENRISKICDFDEVKCESEICVELDKIIQQMLDSDIVEWMNANEWIDIILAMKGLSGSARRRIFSCIEKDELERMLDDFEYTGPVRLLDVEESCERILKQKS